MIFCVSAEAWMSFTQMCIRDRSYTLADGSASWDNTYKAYPTLNVQVTREFRNFAVYAGGENLTGYKQTVSYTHLDVYKRQSLYCASWVGSSTPRS